jgi:hypothetical protein
LYCFCFFLINSLSSVFCCFFNQQLIKWIAELKLELIVPKQGLSATKNKLISKSDPRASVPVYSSMFACLCFAPLAGLVVSDVIKMLYTISAKLVKQPMALNSFPTA